MAKVVRWVALFLFCLSLSLVLVFGGIIMSASSPDEPAEPSVPEENFWGQETLTVAVNDSAAETNVRPLVDEALTWWEGNSTRYAGYPIEFDVARDAEDPDIQIEFVPDVEECDGPTIAVGCATTNNQTDDGEYESRIEIETGYVDANLRTTIKHELGHSLGLDHGQGPGFMNAHMGRSFYRETLIQVRVDEGEDEGEVLRQAELAASTWEKHFAKEFGHDMSIEVEPVASFDDNAHMAYDVTRHRDACDGNATCVDTDPEHADVRVTTAYIYTDQHEYTVGAYFGHFYHLRVEEFPEEYQSMD